MSYQFHRPFNVKLPKSQHEAEEFSAQGGLVLCNNCGACYYKKRWHHSLEKLNSSESEKVSAKDTPVKHALCPACTMIKNKQYEGRIVIKNFPEKWNERLEELVEGFGKRAHDRDPMDRVIGLERAGGDLIITTTENELANKLAQKIKSAFGKVKSRTHFAGDPSDVAEIAMEFE